LIAVFSSGGASVTDFDVSGDRFFALVSSCRSWDKFIITDVSDPENPGPALWSPSIYSSAGRIAASENIVVVTTDDGLLVFDVADPSDPVEVGFLDSPWTPSDLEVENGIAYVALPDEGLRIIDLSDPTNPTEAGSWETSWESHDLEVDDGIVYVADGAGGLRVIDATDPADPMEVSVLETSEGALDVSVDGSIATVGLGTRGVLSVDVSNPATPTKTGVFVTDGPVKDSEMQGGTALAVVGSSELTEVGEFLVLDVSTLEEPTDLASFEFSSSSMDVVVAGSVTYIANGETGLYVVDESNPDETVEEFLDTPGFALDVTFDGQYILVADGYKGLRIIDASDPSDLEEVGFVDTPGYARRVVEWGNYAYIADGVGGLRIINIDNPSSPWEVGFLNTDGNAVDLFRVDEYVYLADGLGGLRIIDVSDPTLPTEVRPDPPLMLTGVRAVAARGGVAVTASNNRTLNLLDISDRRSPRLLNEEERLRGFPTDIGFSSHVFVGTKSIGSSGVDGVDVFEIPYPHTGMRRVGEWNSAEGTVSAIEVPWFQRYAFVAAGGAGVEVLDNICLNTYWVELVANQAGQSGTQWRSDVIIGSESSTCGSRRGCDDIELEFILHTTDGMITGDAAIGQGVSGVFEDIVGILGYEGKGALEIRSERPVTVSSRAYNESASGTMGGFYPGFRNIDCLDDEHYGALYGLRQAEGEYRTNISVTNITDEVRQVAIGLYDAGGDRVGGYEVRVDPGMTVQSLQPFVRHANRPDLGWGMAKVLSGKGGILASATVIDARTNDAMVVPMVPHVIPPPTGGTQ
jgi:hypothetical protein